MKIITWAKCQSMYYRNEWRRLVGVGESWAVWSQNLSEASVKSRQKRMWRRICERICRIKIHEWGTKRNLWIERSTDEKRLEKENFTHRKKSLWKSVRIHSTVFKPSYGPEVSTWKMKNAFIGGLNLFRRSATQKYKSETLNCHSLRVCMTIVYFLGFST